MNKIGENFKEYSKGKTSKFTPLPEDLQKTEPCKITDESYVCSLGYVAEWSKPELLYARSLLPQLVPEAMV